MFKNKLTAAQQNEKLLVSISVLLFLFLFLVAAGGGFRTGYSLSSAEKPTETDFSSLLPLKLTVTSVNGGIVEGYSLRDGKQYSISAGSNIEIKRYVSSGGEVHLEPVPFTSISGGNVIEVEREEASSKEDPSVIAKKITIY